MSIEHLWKSDQLVVYCSSLFETCKKYRLEKLTIVDGVRNFIHLRWSFDNDDIKMMAADRAIIDYLNKTVTIQRGNDNNIPLLQYTVILDVTIPQVDRVKVASRHDRSNSSSSSSDIELTTAFVIYLRNRVSEDSHKVFRGNITI